MLHALVLHARARPGDREALAAVVECAEREQQARRALAWLSGGSDDPTTTWYTGKLHYLAAVADDDAGDAAAAIGELDAAGACFRSAMQRVPEYRDSCEQWLAMCLGKKGNAAFRAGDIDRAEAWLLQAVQLRPDCLATPLGNGDSIKLGILRVGDRTMRDFARTERFFRAAAVATAAAPDPDLVNNAAVYARDLGTRLLRGGDEAAARAMFERSYETYCKAVELDPTSVRMRNDCALVVVHHQRRSWAHAFDLLTAAIADGERQLAAAAADDDRKRDLDAAVGDCYENLAAWHLNHSGDTAAAALAARRSLLHFPQGQRTGAQRALQQAEQRGARSGG